ncbi:MAG: LPS export ABC transporter permease LptG [Gammaproteobacteria bacterium]|nr:LPS export ABC transporter permease LptG [Gammaproteobacteria bacterium]
MSLFERYIASTMLKATLMTLLVLVILLVFFTTMEELEDVGRGDFRAVDAFWVSLLATPRYVFEAFPVAALLGSLVGLGSMGAHGELVAMRSAGFSLHQILVSVMKTGLLMVGLVLVFGEVAAPLAEQHAEQHRAEKQQGQVTLRTEYGFWARDGQAFVNARNIGAGGILRDIHVYEFGPDLQLRRHTHAESAIHRGDQWEMAGIERVSVRMEGIEAQRLTSARWDSLLDPDLLKAVVVQPAMLGLGELYRSIQVMRDNGQPATDYEVAFWGKIATPLSTLVMLFIAVPFVLAHQRFVSMGERVFVGIALGMSFYTLSRGMSYVAVVYEFNPMFSALIPAFAFLVIGVLLMRRVA